MLTPSTFALRRTALAPVLHQITALAALLHDLGKLSILFQYKMRGTSGSSYEPLRHEVLSFLMVWDALDLDQASALYNCDADWLRVLATSPKVFGQYVTDDALLSGQGTAWVHKILAGSSASGSVQFKGDCGKSVLARLNVLRQKLPLLASVLWLVLTHHGLPGTEEENNLERHIHKDRAQQPGVLEQNLRPAPGERPWERAAWQDACKEDAQALLDLLCALPSEAHHYFKGTAWPLAVAHVARPALVLADYKAAILKTETHDLCAGPVVLANTREAVPGGPGLRGGDSLATHLLATRRYASLLFELKDSADKSFCTTSVPADLTSGIRQQDLPENFLWQKTAADQISQALKERPDAGFFGVVVSSTGAGKTQGGLRIMDAMCSGNLRYTLPLSRKSLTLQAGRDYRAGTGLDPSSVAVVIGSRTTQVLGELASKGADCLLRDPLSPDSDDLALSQEETLAVQYEPTAAAVEEAARREQWRQDFEGADNSLFKTQKLLDIISAPVLVTTADHLTGAVELLRGKSCLLTLRLLSAELALDEIDNFSARDLVSLGKLVFMSGLFGRKVLLMSATMSESIVQGFYEAYCKGLSIAGALRGEPYEHLTAVVSNLAKPDVSVGTTYEDFQRRYRANVQAFLKETEAQAPRRRVAGLPLPVGTKEHECFDLIQGECERLHNLNALQDPLTGVRYSVGFVRFNRASTCYRAARHLAAQAAKQGLLVKYVTYHARQTVLGLNAIDTALGRILKRKPSGDLTEHLEVAAVLQEAQAAGRTDVVLIVLTTTLLETGRDQDYDWAVLEPRSNRGEHQAKGRVRRHRPQSWEVQNITILSHPLQTVVHGAGGWRMPGVERPGSPYLVRSLIPGALRPLARALGMRFCVDGPSTALLSAWDALPVREWQTRVSARQCLEIPASYEENPIGALEQLEVHAHLVFNAGLSKANPLLGARKLEPRPLLDYLGGNEQELPLCWTAMHAKSTLFRSSEDARLEYQLFLNPARPAPFVSIACTTGSVSQDVSLYDIPVECEHASAFWFDMPALIERDWADLQQMMPDAGAHLYREAHGCLIASKQPSYLGLRGSYSPYVGFSPM